MVTSDCTFLDKEVMPAMVTEKQLDLALAEKLEQLPEFLQWLLARTKFGSREATFERCRTDNPWGKHPFIEEIRETNRTLASVRESETDLLLLLKAADGETLAVHIENKLDTGRFTKDQAEMYEQRAKHWIGNPKYGGYTDFDTMLIAPKAFLELHRDQTQRFGCFVSHEGIALHIPIFTC